MESVLKQHNIRVTPNRLMVGNVLKQSDRPLSMAEIETAIETIDKSSVLRVLAHFSEHRLIHTIDDGSGSLKYELCRGEHGHSIDDMHVHFCCETCGQVTCLNTEPIPSITLPEGYTITSAAYMVRGHCPHCARQS